MGFAFEVVLVLQRVTSPAEQAQARELVGTSFGKGCGVMGFKGSGPVSASLALLSGLGEKPAEGVVGDAAVELGCR